MTGQSIGLKQSFERRQISQPDGRSLLLYESPMFEFNKCVRQVVDPQSQQVGYEPGSEAIGYDGWIASFAAIVAGYRGQEGRDRTWLLTAASDRLRTTGSTRRVSPRVRKPGDRSEPCGVINPYVIVAPYLPRW